tara:strand:+ start:201 stop:1115 length:915 start_codon:yes stop_codon:yes gene_type:complete
MIVGEVKGGLANQMFQYAFYKTIANINNCDLILDLNFWNNDPSLLIQWNVDPKKTKVGNFELNAFNIELKLTNKYDVDKLYILKYPFYKKFIVKKIYTQVEKLKPIHKKVIVKQKKTYYDSELLKIKSNTFISGFFQHHQYLELYREFFFKKFTIKNNFVTDDFIKLKTKIRAVNSISIHVRRGDYVKLNHSCSLGYFDDSIIYIEERIDNPIFYVFSDDINWCKKSLSFKSKPIFIDDQYKLEDYHELMLMKYCKHNIISNSSFSWWGAWLNENTNKIVIYPDKIKETLNKDLCVESWVELKN